MTAVNVLFEPTCVHLFTDGLALNVDGSAADKAVAKAVPIPHLIAAVAVRGPRDILWLAAEMLCREFHSFDDAVERMAAVIKGRVEEGLAMEKPSPILSEKFEIIVVGWSEARERFEAYELPNHDGTSLGGTWALQNVSEGLISPGDPGLLDRLEGKVDLDALADPVTDGLEIMRQQRLCLGEYAGRNDVVAVGAFCQLTTVTREAMTTRILERWPS